MASLTAPRQVAVPTIKGTLYAFDTGVRNLNPVPGPLPVIGIGAAFGWSRQLRRRVAQASPRKR